MRKVSTTNRESDVSSAPASALTSAVITMATSGVAAMTAMTAPARCQVLGINKAYVKIITSQQGATSGKTPYWSVQSTDFSYCRSRKNASGTPNVTSSTQRSCRVVIGHSVQSEKPIAARISVATKWAT